MPRIIRAPSSRRDIDEIFDYVSDRASVERAATLISEIEKQLTLLAEYPRMGRARPDLLPDLRSVPISSYVIYYQALSDGIEVVRVLHERRDVSSDLF